MAANQKINLNGLEPHYRAGIKSLRQLAQEFGCTSGRVAQIAKEQGWTRDLSERIRAKADAKLNRAILSDKVSGGEKDATENQIVEENADMMVAATLGHRKDAVQLRQLCRNMVSELAEISGKPLELKALIEAVVASGDALAAKDLRQVLSLPSRIVSLDKLSAALDRLIKLERVVLGIDKDKGKGGTIEEMYAQLDRMGAANG
jgi:hypothetical protein